MPEVIEILRYADFLRSNLKGKHVSSITILKGRYLKHGAFENYDKIVSKLPLKVIDVFTKGKFLYIHFEKGFYMFSTLGLQGGWCSSENGKDNFIFPLENEYINLTPDMMAKYKKNSLNHLNVEFTTTTCHTKVYFYDVLSYGTLKVVCDETDLYKKLSSIGADILHVSFDEFVSRIRLKKNQNKPIGNVLLDQKTISGIGNYLRADILWMSKLSPFRLVKNLEAVDIETLYRNCKLLTWGEYNFDEGVNKQYYEKRSKLPKDYGRLFFVYMQEEDIYSNKVKTEPLSKDRTIHWCPEYQK